MQFELFGGRYLLQDPVGRDGMFTVCRALDLQTDRVVIIKVLREVYNTDAKFVARFQQEAKAASALQHPNIVQVYDYGQTGGNYYIVMELVEGTDLRRYLRSRGVLDIDRSVIIAHDVALGLGAAHRRGIVHRDVKPQNVLVGRGGSIKLTDFGIASVYKDINAERLTTTGMTLGTVQYYAPEQAQGEIVSPAADVYALGIVMYEMLTGRTPFDGDNPVAVAMQHIEDPPTPPSQLNPTIPPALADIILRCLEKVPEMRFRDGSQLARALETLDEAEMKIPPHPIATHPNYLNKNRVSEQLQYMSDGDRFDKFTERARKVLTLAQEEAQRLQHNYIGTEHLLLGLVREGEGVAARVLRSLGIELNQVRSNVEFIIGRGERIVLGEIGLTPRAKKVVELAVDEARRLKHDYIGTGHLLLGMMREGGGIAAGVLESLGANMQKVRAHTLLLLDRIHKNNPPNQGNEETPPA